MEKIIAGAEELADNVREYVNTRIESVKLNAAEKSSAVIANVAAGFIVAIILLFAIALAAVALSLVLGAWIGKTWMGFLIVGGFFLVLGLIIWTARGKIIRIPVMNNIIQQLCKTDEDGED